MSNYQLLILSGPSGAGKSSLAELLLEKNDISKCITCTTRSPRAGEVDGVDYYFLSTESFEKQMRRGLFVEYSFHYGQWYGVRLLDIEKCMQLSHSLITLNWQGAKVLEQKLSNVHLFYIEPPSMEELEKRLEDRGCHTRFTYAEEDMKHAALFSNRVVNDNLKLAYKRLEKMVHSLIKEKV